MGLRFGGARADRVPADQIAEILRDDRVQRFSRRGQTKFGKFDQKAARQRQSALDIEAVVELGIVDQAFPTDGCPRFFEIDAHDHQQLRGEFARERGQPPGILTRGSEVVH